MNLAQIESAISYLPSHDFAALMRWLGEYVAAQLDNEEWDRKISGDSAAGRLDGFVHDAMQHVKANQTTPL